MKEEVQKFIPQDLEDQYVGALMTIKSLQSQLEEAKRENVDLREWVREEGRRCDLCTYEILKEVCIGCRCGKQKAQS
jgi:hypothetical protein